MQLLSTHNLRGSEMTDADQSYDSQYIYCLTQNRLGAMDRVLGALTHRGIIPQKMVSTLVQDNQVEMFFTFQKQDEKTVEKLVKFLQKQVYVIQAYTLESSAQTKNSVEASNITPLFVSDIIDDQPQRRMAHAHNA
jgi:acetolactate synthase small subunit